MGKKRVWWSKASESQKAKLVVDEIRKQAEEKRSQTAIQQGQQGRWTTWEDALQRSLSWNDIWHLAPLRISFLIRAVYDQLPSGDNLKKWQLTDDENCPLCGATQTLQHVLSACKEALAKGRYTWRHNQVLGRVVEAIEEAKKVNGSSPSSQPRSILGGANDWKITADLPGRRDYPCVIQSNNCRPDIVLTSEAGKVCIVVELTVPFESNMSERHEIKLAKYEGLCTELRRHGFKTLLFAVEVGARGFCGSSAYSLLKQLGLQASATSRYLRLMAEAAEKASYWIWLKRNDKGWIGENGKL